MTILRHCPSDAILWKAISNRDEFEVGPKFQPIIGSQPDLTNPKKSQDILRKGSPGPPFLRDTLLPCDADDIASLPP
jgi:hypothetical protein